MRENTSETTTKDDFKCPECSGELKRRRTRKVDACEMLCGVCGASFDVCDLETVEKLKNYAQKE